MVSRWTIWPSLDRNSDIRNRTIAIFGVPLLIYISGLVEAILVIQQRHEYHLPWLEALIIRLTSARLGQGPLPSEINTTTTIPTSWAIPAMSGSSLSSTVIRFKHGSGNTEGAFNQRRKCKNYMLFVRSRLRVLINNSFEEHIYQLEECLDFIPHFLYTSRHFHITSYGTCIRSTVKKWHP